MGTFCGFRLGENIKNIFEKLETRIGNCGTATGRDVCPLSYL